jgi:hypothetical protein
MATRRCLTFHYRLSIDGPLLSSVNSLDLNRSNFFPKNHAVFDHPHLKPANIGGFLQ